MLESSFIVRDRGLVSQDLTVQCNPGSFWWNFQVPYYEGPHITTEQARRLP
jgi:hypothetical protein